MNNIWNELSEESKDIIKREYLKYSEATGFKNTDKVKTLEELFGEENLKPKLQIKTWEDVVKQTGYSIKDDFVILPDGSGDDCIWYQSSQTNIKVVKKVISTFKIAKLIELGYGGMITNEEWQNLTIPKYVIQVYTDGLNNLEYDVVYGDKYFIAFRTKELREEFIKHNEQLCKDYYMI